MKRKFKELKQILEQDMISYKKIKKEDISLITKIKFYFSNPGYKIIFWMRMCKYLSNSKFKKILFLIARIKYHNLQIKYGIQIDYNLQVGEGFTIHHYGGIVINRDAKIGKNCSIRSNTVIGMTEKGVPTIGDNVYIGVNSVIIGPITIGNNCIVGAGSVVTKNFDDNCVIAGNPAKEIRKIYKE